MISYKKIPFKDPEWGTDRPCTTDVNANPYIPLILDPQWYEKVTNNE